MRLPYENASSGQRAIAEIEKLLRQFGCSRFGVMTDYSTGSVVCQFEYRGRAVSINASYQGYAALWLKNNPTSRRSRTTTAQRHEIAKRKGEMAVPSILRDYIKGQIMVIEAGLVSFEGAFLAHMLLPNGQRVLDKAQSVLQLEGPDQ